MFQIVRTTNVLGLDFGNGNDRCTYSLNWPLLSLIVQEFAFFTLIGFSKVQDQNIV